MAKLGVVSTFDLVATLAGAPGTFEGVPAISFTPPEAVTAVVVADDNLNFTVDFAIAGDVLIDVVVDPLGGDAVGSLTGSALVTVAPAEPVVLADALAVTERV